MDPPLRHILVVNFEELIRWLEGEAHLTKMWSMLFQMAVMWLSLLLEHRLSHTSNIVIM
jgi:hypothetical protein